MKKRIKIVVLLLLVSCLGYLTYSITKKLNHKKEVATRIQTLPSFSFETLTGEIYTNHSLPKKTIVFVYFNSDCDYCKSKAMKIQERLADFKKSQLVFVSFEKQEGIQKFATQYKLNEEENIVFLEDKKGVFSDVFDVNSIPYIVVYDKNKELLGKFKGATKIDAILKLLS